MLAGRVKWFDCKKGFGFIVNNDGQDVFAHYKVIEGDGFRALQEGEVVSYEPGVGPNGLRALKVVRTTEKRQAKVRPSEVPSSVLAAQISH